jgi:hypothetical protein
MRKRIKMHKWQFWEDGVLGIASIIGGLLFVLTSNSILKTLYAGKGLSPQKIKGKRKLFIIGGIVFIVYGILTLLRYIE